MVQCNSCNYEGNNFTSFECPECNEEIVRCDKCKKLSIEYKCRKCNFKGP